MSAPGALGVNTTHLDPVRPAIRDDDPRIHIWLDGTDGAGMYRMWTYDRTRGATEAERWQIAANLPALAQQMGTPRLNALEAWRATAESTIATHDTLIAYLQSITSLLNTQVAALAAKQTRFKTVTTNALLLNTATDVPVVWDTPMPSTVYEVIPHCIATTTGNWSVAVKAGQTKEGCVLSTKAGLLGAILSFKVEARS